MKLKVSAVNWSVLWLAMAAASCSGASDAQTPGGDDEGDGEPGPGEDDAPPPAAACELEAEQLPAVRLWRLSPRQYANTLRLQYGYELDPGALPADAPSGEGFAVFDTLSFDKQVSEAHFGAYGEVARAVATRVLAEPDMQSACIVSAPDAGCVRDFVASQGERAFRRPLEEGETERFAALFESAKPTWGEATAARLVVEAMLQSPHHLYRVELGSGDGERVALTQFELANQISYMFADGPPDAALMAAARAGELRDPAAVRAHAERLLDEDANGRDKLTDFVTQMFSVSPALAGGLNKDQAKFPSWSAGLRDDMLKETRTFVGRLLFDEGGSWQELFSAPYTYANAALAKHYGMGEDPGDFERLTLPPHRQGLLGHASVLAATSPADRTSPAHRGLTIYTKLLCNSIPKAPPGATDQAAGTVIAPNPDYTQREHWQFALDNAPQCTGCHSQFVPLGLGLEQFDAIGTYRQEEFGKPLDTSVEVKGFDDAIDGRHENTLQLAARLSGSQAGAACAVLQMSSFAFGRAAEDMQGSCEVDKLAERFLEGGLDARALLLDLTQTTSFYERRRGS